MLLLGQKRVRSVTIAIFKNLPIEREAFVKQEKDSTHEQHKYLEVPEKHKNLDKLMV
jgi:hypothetical protein